MDYISNFISQYGALFAQGTVDTLVMTLASTLFAYLIGVPLGVLLVITAKDGLKPQRALNTVLGWIVNIGRSIPFIILLVAIIPFPAPSCRLPWPPSRSWVAWSSKA